jgi:ERCC4-type nuclease
LGAFVPWRKWSDEEKRWVYPVPAKEHENALARVVVDFAEVIRKRDEEDEAWRLRHMAKKEREERGQ